MSTPNIRTQTSALERRIRKFYGILNEHEFAKCYRSIDPSIRTTSSGVTQFQYENALRQFVTYYGQISIVKVTVQLHVDEPNALFGNRDFAVGQTIWTDAHGEEHVFQERWVRDGQRWYTRSTGYVTSRSGRRSKGR